MRSMLSIRACGIGLALLSGVPASAEELTISTTIGFESRYVFRGIQFAETSFQPAINLGYGGFYGFAWANLPIGDDDLVVTPGGEELDLVGGYSAALNDFVTYDIGFTYYTFPDAASGFFDVLKENKGGGGANTFEPFVGFTFSAPLTPKLYFYRDVYLDTFTVQGTLSHSIPLAEKWSADLSGYAAYVFDDDPGGDYLYGVASANLTYAFSDDSSVYLGARFGGSDIAGGSIIDDSIAGTTKSSGFWWGVGFTSAF